MKRVFKKRGFSIWIFILGMLGFSSCILISTEYGTPTATFKMNGAVESAQTNEPIQGIKVVLKQKIVNSDASFVHAIDSTVSNSNGEFDVSVVEFPENQEFILSFEDIDASLNGSFEPLDTTVVFTNPAFKNGTGNWYSGETSKSLSIKIKEE